MTATERNTAIVLDSTSDFQDAPERFPNMRVVPLYVHFGDETFRDFVDLDPHAFYDKLRGAATLPTTSQPTPQDFLDAYGELVEAGYERIWSLHLSAKLSGTYQSAALAADELGGERVRVVDTGTASLTVGMLSLAMQRRLERGTTDEELEQLVERFRSANGVVFTVGTLEYLQKGGRIGRAQALAGALLNVKPILAIRDGVVEPIARVRGRQKALEEFAKVFSAATTDRAGLRVSIAHADAPEWVEILTDLAQKVRPQAEVELVATLGAVVGTHAGPGAVGFFWLADDE
ncbi:MAG TPA: DegV family protein [Gaiellaceae bacterium]|jgi:DegV family protein with EDD domain